jgi:hypothetical protein
MDLPIGIINGLVIIVESELFVNKGINKLYL